MTSVVLITGGSEGIGRATAFAFARQGYRLSLAARDQQSLMDTAIALEQELDADVLVTAADVTQPDQVQHWVDRTLERYGQINIVINNAGICLSGPFTATDLAHWQQVMDTNFWGYVHVIRAVLPHLQGRGQIINIGSFGGKMPLPQMAAYCASKYAVAGLTESLRLELAPRGIEVIGVHPGVVESDFLKRAIFVGPDPAASKTQMQETLQSALASQPEQVAEAILDASRFHKTDVVVGWAQVATGAYNLFPDLVGALLRGGPT